MISADRVRAILAEIRKLPYIQVYVGDWMKDSVSGCTLAAQMLWMRMIFLMHDAPVYGHLVDAKGRPLEESRLARMCGARTAGEYRRGVDELFAAGVPGETEDDDYAPLFAAQINGEDVDLSPMRIDAAGVIYCRRMVRDHRLRVVRRLVGQLGTPKGGDLVPQTSEGLGAQTGHSLTRTRGTYARERDDNDNEVGLSSPSQITESREGVQGGGGVSVPDFGAAARIYERLRQSALKEIPPEQVAIGLLGDFGEDLILETLVDCENEYAGKPWRYFEKILIDRQNNPEKRPTQRRARKANDGNGHGRRSDSAGPSAPPKDPRPFGRFSEGKETPEEVLARVRRLKAEGRLPEV